MIDMILRSFACRCLTHRWGEWGEPEPVYPGHVLEFQDRMCDRCGRRERRMLGTTEERTHS